MKTNLLELSPVLMIIGGIALFVASHLAKYIGIILIVLGIILLGLSIV
ncbi:MAG TPA: hypothetical protein VI968_03615 [archaeon]|nr:hypothetical protein [archaeon]